MKTSFLLIPLVIILSLGCSSSRQPSGESVLDVMQDMQTIEYSSPIGAVDTQVETPNTHSQVRILIETTHAEKEFEDLADLGVVQSRSLISNTSLTQYFFVGEYSAQQKIELIEALKNRGYSMAREIFNEQ